MSLVKWNLLGKRPECPNSKNHRPDIKYFNLDKKIDGMLTKDTKPLRARSRSLVKSLKKLSRSVSCSGSVPRYDFDLL